MELWESIKTDVQVYSVHTAGSGPGHHCKIEQGGFHCTIPAEVTQDIAGGFPETCRSFMAVMERVSIR